MMRITELFDTFLRGAGAPGCRFEAEGNTVRLYLTAEHDDDTEQELFERLVHALVTAKMSETVELLPVSRRMPPYPGTVDERPLSEFLEEDWQDALLEADGDESGSLYHLECHSVVGLSCLRLILRTDYLMAQLIDVDSAYFRALYAGTARQCRVWLHG